MSKRVGIAMIGHGFMGRAHSNAWRQAPRFFPVPYEPVLKVLCGRDLQATRAAAAQFGFAEAATDWPSVVARGDVDIVDICTPGDSHAPIAIAAAAAGKAVLCEKPLANSVADAETMRSAVEGAGVANLVCHNYRRAPAVALAAEMIAAGEIGAVLHYRGTYLQDWLLNPARPLSWRLQRARCGSGALGDIASHAIDLARWLVGEMAEVCGMLRTFIPDRPLAEGGSERGAVDVDDAALALCRFANGAVGSIEATRMAAGRRNYNRFEINGAGGSVAFDLERLNELYVYRDDGPNSGFRRILVTEASHPYAGAWWPSGHILGYEHTFVHTVVDFLNAMHSGTRVMPDFADGVQTLRVLEAIARSAASRCWEPIPAPAER